ncbi:MAG: helix-turn-helix transcriptional regulator [Acidobacteria bacterium]|nr:helix-turn-helix transcriptional regulator [Acidobacteriota bacterium]
MPRRVCPRHGRNQPCSCAMGNLYRFVEPVVLFLLQRRGLSYGYELATELREHALTDAAIEAAALYRSLRQLEQNGCVESEWDVEHGGPARRLYRLTSKGRQHLDEWIAVLDHMSASMRRLVTEARRGETATRTKPAAMAGRESEPPTPSTQNEKL